MYENVPYKAHPGRTLDHTVYVYGMTNCAYCQSARKQIEEAGLEYHYVSIDLVAHKDRIEMVRDLKARSDNKLLLPVLEYGQTFLFGYNEEKWRETLGM